MTSSITQYTSEPLGQVSEPECLINPPDQAYKSEELIPSCMNEVDAVFQDEKEDNTASAQPPTV